MPPETTTAYASREINRHEALNNGQCPDCGSDNGYWKLGSVADFQWVCVECRGIFDEDTAERVAEKPQPDAVGEL
jgi:hypothetical protein